MTRSDSPLLGFVPGPEETRVRDCVSGKTPETPWLSDVRWVLDELDRLRAVLGKAPAENPCG